MIRRVAWLRADLGIAVLVLAAVALLRLTPAWQDLSGRSFDLLTTAAPPTPAAPGIVVVAIDEPSFAELGMQWPWPRSIHAGLIRALRGAGVKTIGFDIVFAEPSNAQDDTALAEASGPDVVFAGDETLTETPQGTLLNRTEPLPPLVASGAGIGIVSMPVDGDGVARRVPAYPDGFARRLLERSGIAARHEPGAGKRIQYFGPPGSYPRVSYYQALDPARFLPPDMLRGATVIVGYNLQSSPEVETGGIDVFETPHTLASRRLMAGPELHATLFDNLAHGLSIREAPPVAAWVAMLGGVIAGLTLGRPSRVLVKALLTIGGVIVTLALAWVTVRYGRVWISPSEPAFALAFTAIGIAARDFAAEQKRRREVQGAFGQYVSPEIVDRLVADPALLKLGGERKTITVLFSDIRGFTSISEAMRDDPEGLVHVINDILSPLSDIVMAHGGTIDKYIGDCLMAFWNAPLDDPDHALNAVRCGQAMVAAIGAVNAAIADRLPAGVEIRMGVGINSGDCVVGNMGSTKRFNYSVMGDAVNVASRLEGKSKDYGVPILIGEGTAHLVAGRVRLRELDRVAVRGKAQHLAVFTPAE